MEQIAIAIALHALCGALMKLRMYIEASPYKRTGVINECHLNASCFFVPIPRTVHFSPAAGTKKIDLGYEKWTLCLTFVILNLTMLALYGCKRP